MILIEERKSVKLPNLTSLFFKLNFYDKNVQQQLEQQKICAYNKKTNE